MLKRASLDSEDVHRLEKVFSGVKENIYGVAKNTST
jgi:hypothetical protein